jgi:hypothetical protein
MKVLERITEFAPAFDKRDPDPKKNYGIHGVDLRMVLKGEEGAVQFVLFTGWMLPHVAKELICYYDGSGLNAERIFGVMLREGSDGVWKALEEYYEEIFGAAEQEVVK